MPKDRINDQTQQRWHVEVSWRRKPSTPPDDRGPAEGHVQLASVNLDSPLEFPERETDGAWEAGERFDGWRVTLDEDGCDRLIKALHKAKRQAFGSEDGPQPRLERIMSEDHGSGCILRDVSSIPDYAQWRCVRPEHEGLPCYVTGEGVQVGPGVTVESDATAAARLDVDRYRAVRRGDR